MSFEILHASRFIPFALYFVLLKCCGKHALLDHWPLEHAPGFSLACLRTFHSPVSSVFDRKAIAGKKGTRPEG